MQVAARELVLDYNLYPRQNLDPFTLSRLKEARRGGAVFPAVIVEKGTNRVADGFHRVTVVLKVDGDAAMIEAQYREYPNEAALFEEAMLLNARHGTSLTNSDRLRCILLARQMGITDEKTAASLSITAERLGELVFERTATGPDGQLEPLKWTSVPTLARRPITAAQIIGNKAAGGMPVKHYAVQILNALENDLVNWDDVDLVHRLGVLRDQLGLALVDRVPAVPA